VVGLELLAEEEEAPYIGFEKIVDNGKIIWKRVEKAPLTRMQIKKIKAMKTDQARLLSTEDKRLWFYSRIDSTKNSAGRTSDFLSVSPITILVERSHFLRDSFEQFRTTSDLDLRKEIKIHFIDEICQDAGGLIREWFSVLTEELFNSDFGLFVKTNTPEFSYTINVNAESYHDDYLEYYFFCGQILAKALFERIPIKAYLSKFLLKRLTSNECDSDDLKYFDIELYRSIQYIQNNKLDSEADVGTFCVNQKNIKTGKEEIIELKEDGKNIKITELNKIEFIKLFTKYHLEKSIEKQFEEIALGFFSLIPAEIIQALDNDELELFLCGDNEISLKDWKDNTKYKGVYNENHYVIKWFWNIIEKLSNYEREKFLQFCTGSSRVPAEGFKGLSSNNGKVSLFCIESKSFMNDGTDFLVAHTCFNRLELPIYPTEQALEDVIRKIISTPICYQFSFE